MRASAGALAGEWNRTGLSVVHEKSLRIHAWLVAGVLGLSGAAFGQVIVIDNDNANNSAGTFSTLPGAAWSVTGLPTYVGQWGADYAYKETSDPAGTVEWRPVISQAGAYDVAVWYRSTGSGRPNNAQYTVDHLAGSTAVAVNQQVAGSSWVTLGRFDFAAGTAGHVTLTSTAQAGKTIVADAVRFRRVGDAAPPTRVAGMRVSSIPFSPFPQPPFFIDTANCMTTKVSGDAAPALIWIVSLYWSNGNIGLNFPNPTGQAQPHMNFSATDKNEAHLTAFDAAGVNVWLQVEPGDADMEDLIDIVLGKYGHHPCVIGFGVDVEWFNPTVDPSGRAVTDVEAQTWNNRVKAHDPDYRLFLKHYAQSRMPPTLRGDLLFVDDSQGFASLNSMVNEFRSWGTRYAPAQVGFQYGYPNDRPWWSTYADPAGVLTAALDNAIPNADAFFWVDFTIQEITPLAGAPEVSLDPQAQTVQQGGSALLSVATSSTSATGYAWRRNGVPLGEGGHYSGVNTPDLVVFDADASLAGAYDCVLSNRCDSATSAAAALSVRPAGDLDDDGAVDSADVPDWTDCLLGPDVTHPAGDPCRRGDADADQDVDLRDAAAFQRNFGQP